MADNLDNLTNDELRERIRLLQQQLNLSRGVTSHAQKYLESTKKSIEIQKQLRNGGKDFLNVIKTIADLNKTINALGKQAVVAKGKNKKAIEDEITKLKAVKKLYEDNLKVVNKTNIAVKEIGKVIANLPDSIKGAYGKLKGFGLFEIDKSIRSSALSMGLLGKRSDSFRSDIKAASQQAILMGGSIEEMAKMQSDFSEELGRAVMLGKEGFVALTKMAKGTGMGADAAARMAAEMDAQGLSAEKTAEFVEQIATDVSKMGLNANKVVKNIQNNIKLLNRYNFKTGIKGLAKMAETVSKLGIEMNDIAPLADKLFDIEGAVEMSAQLQVMGGKWAALSDPFKLMYQARNDMEGLTKAIGEASAESASFDKDGNIQLSTYEMSRLRKVAEQTGIEYDKLVTAGKNAFKMSRVGMQMKFKMDDDVADFVKNASFFENGKAFIRIGADKKLVSDLDKSSQSLIRSQILEKRTLEERAKDAMTFDDNIRAIMDTFKSKMLPFVEVLKNKIGPALDRFMARFEKEKWGEKIEKLATWVGNLVSTLGSWIADNPIKSALAWGAAKIIGTTAGWVANGLALATGFNMGASGGGGIMGALRGLLGGGGAAGAAGAAGSGAAGGAGSMLGGIASKAGTAALVAGVVKDQVDFFSSKSARNTGFGGWLESLGGSGMSLIDWIPGINQLVEGSGLSIDNMGTDNVALARAVYRSIHPDAPTVIPNKDLIADIRKNPASYPDTVVDDARDVRINDGVIKFNPKDKFTKINDGTMIAGTNENGNQALAKAIMSTSAPSMSNIPTSLEVKMNELKINGVIELKIDGQNSKDISSSLLNNPMFIRDISKMVNMATARAISGTQPQRV